TTARRFEVVSDEVDAVDLINQLCRFCRTVPFERRLETAIMDLSAAEDDFFGALNSPQPEVRKFIRFQLAHAGRLCDACATLIPDYLALLEAAPEDDNVLPRIYPGADRLTCRPGRFTVPQHRISPARIARFRAMAASADPFCIGRTFRYINGRFVPVTLHAIRPVEKFYGYAGVKDLYLKHFTAFVRGEANIPLLISSLPGMGKTHFSISYALHFPELTLILPDPEDLEAGLAGLIERLSRRKNHQFAVFFDDVDARNIDWYHFRTHVGGSFALPGNIIIMIASNYEFPPNIYSRGREVRFPLFDNITCQGMIYDYLLSLKLRHPSPDLISVMAADYQEEFGQKVYAELSPRTMVRYLDIYDHDPNKRRRMLEMSKQDVISKPDPQMFNEFNLKLVRRLYGEEGIEELRNQMLQGMLDD
ncbi:MAG: hypothetical protein PHQ27_05165, partial [Victivallales bacterium]|nr:hypothetical protein [Victivallales bacterium]